MIKRHSFFSSLWGRFYKPKVEGLALKFSIICYVLLRTWRRCTKVKLCWWIMFIHIFMIIGQLIQLVRGVLSLPTQSASPGEREKYYLQAYLSSNQHKTVAPMNMLPIHLKWPWVHYCGILRTYLWCQINSKKGSLRGAYYFRAFVLDEREVHSYTTIPLSSSPYTCSLCIKILVGAYQERAKHASKQAAPPYSLIHLVTKQLNYWSNSGVPRGCMQIANIWSTCV
jgi:hypothetical protein